MVNLRCHTIDDYRDCFGFIRAHFRSCGRLIALLFQEGPCQSRLVHDKRTLEIFKTPELFRWGSFHDRSFHNSYLCLQWVDHILLSTYHYSPSQVRFRSAHSWERILEASGVDRIRAHDKLFHPVVSKRPDHNKRYWRLWKIQPY